MKSNIFLLILFLSVFSGCNYNMPREVVVENTNESKPPRDPAIVEAEKRILTEDPLILSETSDTKTIPCNNREIEISEDSTASSYKLTGECKKVTVAGVSNDVSVDKVGEIIVSGSSNKVIYGEGLEGKKPKITKSGVSTDVISRKNAEEKQKAQNN